MLTTCPECRTTFRVVNEQLEAKRGLVRCGYCHAVFNAYDTLLPEFHTLDDESHAAVGEPVPANPIQDTHQPVVESEFAEQVSPADAEPEVPVSEVEPEPESEPEPEIDLSRQVDETGAGLDAYEEIDLLGLRSAEPEPEPDPSIQLETPDDILLSELPDQKEGTHAAAGWHVWLYGLASLVLLVTLVLQGLYFLRGPIVQALPEARPYFESVCASLGCSVPLSHQLGLFKVESSSLETDPEQSAHAKLKVDFSNRSRQPQAWPAFVLRLSDLNNKPLSQRIFWPKDYLPKGKREADGMPPMSELEFQIDLDMSGLPAAGYEIKPQYP